MIYVKVFLARIFLKNAPTCSRGSIVYQKYKNNFGVGFKVGGNESINPSVSFTCLIFGFCHKKLFFFFIIPGVSRTFDLVL